MRKPKNIHDHRSTIFLFLLPSCFVLFCVAALPLLQTFFYSFTNARLMSMSHYDMVGFSNYVDLFNDDEWWGSFRNTFDFTLISVSIETILGLAIALVINSNLPGKGVARAAILVPWAIPTIVSAKMWAWMFHDFYGVINHSLIAMHLIQKPITWLADPHLSFIVIIAIDVWKATPFMALMILAALQSVPHNLSEAAAIDGAGIFQRFYYITLPLIKPGLMVAIIFRMLDALRVFDVIYVIAKNSTNVKSMSIYVQETLISFKQVGYGSAAASLLFMTLAVFTIIYITIAKVRLTGKGEI